MRWFSTAKPTIADTLGWAKPTIRVRWTSEHERREKKHIPRVNMWKSSAPSYETSAVSMDPAEHQPHHLQYNILEKTTATIISSMISSCKMWLPYRRFTLTTSRSACLWTCALALRSTINSYTHRAENKQIAWRTVQTIWYSCNSYSICEANGRSVGSLLVLYRPPQPQLNKRLFGSVHGFISSRFSFPFPLFLSLAIHSQMHRSDDRCHF